jgi:hypothetical protein
MLPCTLPLHASVFAQWRSNVAQAEPKVDLVNARCAAPHRRAACSIILLVTCCCAHLLFVSRVNDFQGYSLVRLQISRATTFNVLP